MVRWQARRWPARSARRRSARTSSRRRWSSRRRPTPRPRSSLGIAGNAGYRGDPARARRTHVAEARWLGGRVWFGRTLRLRRKEDRQREDTQAPCCQPPEESGPDQSARHRLASRPELAEGRAGVGPREHKMMATSTRDSPPHSAMRRSMIGVAAMPQAFTVGVEEEFQIVDPDTWELRSHVSELLASSAPSLGDQIKRRNAPVDRRGRHPDLRGRRRAAHGDPAHAARARRRGRSRRPARWPRPARIRSRTGWTRSSRPASATSTSSKSCSSSRGRC